MPDAPVGVDDAVEKMLGSKPAADTAAKEVPAEAPASAPADKGERVTEDSKEESAERSAFEQELIADLDEDDRKAFEEASPAEQERTLGFLKKTYRRTARQMTELGTLRKAVSSLQEAGVTNEDLVALVQSKRGGTKADAQKVVDAAASGNGASKRGYQRWMEEAKTPEDRERLRDAEQVVREVVEDVVAGLLDREVKPLKQRLELSDRQQMTERAQSLEASINTLEDELGYPGSLVETHRQEMLREGLRYPKLEAEDLLVRVAGFKAVKSAMLKAQGTNGKREEASPALAKPGAPIIKRPAATGTTALPRKHSGAVSINTALDWLMRPAKK